MPVPFGGTGFLSHHGMTSSSIKQALFLIQPVILALALFAVLPTRADAADRIPTAVILRASDYAETVPRETIISWLRLETTLSIDTGRRSEIEDPSYCPTIPSYCDFSVSRSVRSHVVIGLESTTDREAIRTFVSALADRVARDPENAVFSAGENGAITVAKQERTGLKLSQEGSIETLAQSIESGDSTVAEIALPVETVPATVASTDLERLGLKELVGSGRSNFRGSPKNRIYNIKHALKRFDGALIAPGETFSFVDVLGEVDGEHGYLPELVIKDNKTTPEFGGGICQVSSTVFRAAIYSGLKIAERRNHAYPVRYYYPYGMDATIYIPKPDLRFVNNTPGYILMQPVVDGTELTFNFYGTKDGRTTTVDGPHILESNPDGSMKTVFSQLVTDASGEAIIKDSFWSNYKSPSLFPHPGEETILTEKPKDWSAREWKAYKAIHP